MRTHAPARVRTRSFGFHVGRGKQRQMETADQHNEIELNFINRGEMAFRHGAKECIIPQGEAILYWAATPHQVVATAASTEIIWIVLPLSWLLYWNLAPRFTQCLLQGEMLWLSKEAPEQLSQMPLARWVQEFETGSLELRKVVELELEAFFRRLALNLRSSRKGRISRHPRHGSKDNYRRVQRMVRFITEHATEPLTIIQISREAGLSAEYAMRLFRKHWGVTLWTFLIQQRVSHAKRLLALGDAKVADIAFQCGFGSVSRFYSAFTRHCHCPPMTFRHRCFKN